MGMAAGQARFLGLTARKSNVEFEGQQINQQRTTLANETSTYNAQLLSLNVPTAPSSDTYTKTSYSWAQNGTQCTITGTNLQNDGTYNVSYTTPTTKDVAEQGSLYAVTSTTANGTTSYKYNGNTLTQVATDASGNYTDTTDASNIALIKSTYGIGTKITAGTGTAAAVTSSTAADKTVTYSLGTNALTAVATDSSGNVTDATDKANIAAIMKANSSIATGTKFYKATVNGSTQYLTASQVTSNADQKTTVAPYTATSSAEKFYKCTFNGTAQYLTESQLSANADQSTTVASYNVQSESVNEKHTLTGANVTWSSSGRMESLTVGGQDFSLNTNTTTDSGAYNDAMNEYEYQKELYNQSLNQINAKVSVIQQQDKTLELKLKQVDTEQQAISTELDAVKKVVDKNVESTFKTFG